MKMPSNTVFVANLRGLIQIDGTPGNTAALLKTSLYRILKTTTISYRLACEYAPDTAFELERG